MKKEEKPRKSAKIQKKILSKNTSKKAITKTPGNTHKISKAKSTHGKVGFSNKIEQIPLTLEEIDKKLKNKEDLTLLTPMKDDKKELHKYKSVKGRQKTPFRSRSNKDLQDDEEDDKDEEEKKNEKEIQKNKDLNSSKKLCFSSEEEEKNAFGSIKKESDIDLDLFSFLDPKLKNDDQNTIKQVNNSEKKPSSAQQKSLFGSFQPFNSEKNKCASKKETRFGKILNPFKEEQK